MLHRFRQHVSCVPILCELSPILGLGMSACVHTVHTPEKFPASKFPLLCSSQSQNITQTSPNVRGISATMREY